MKRYLTTSIFAFSCWCVSPAAVAGTITLTGAITQSTPDGTGPASNNPSLNNIVDGELFTITLTFPGTLSGAGSYAVTPSFSVPAAPATESDFGASTLTVTANGGRYDFSLLACLTTGGGCSSGDELTANFQIAAASLNGQNVAATGLDQPHPMDLLEDDGTTDIQGRSPNIPRSLNRPSHG
jgi:hypothetical protein